MHCSSKVRESIKVGGVLKSPDENFFIQMELHESLLRKTCNGFKHLRRVG